MEGHQWCEGFGGIGRGDDLSEGFEVGVELAWEEKVGELEGAITDADLLRRVQ
jgi:hypothetical protein